MNHFFLALLGLLLLGSTSCNREPEIDLKESFDIRYKVTFEAYWSEESHPLDHPSNASFSSVFALSHNDTTRIFRRGDLSSEALADFATEGFIAPIQELGIVLIQEGRALDRMTAFGISSPGTTHAYIGVDEAHSQVTAVARIQPSPDWFVAVEAVELRENGAWVSSKAVEVVAFDAGVDAGSSFEASPMPNEPTEPISEITNAPLGIGGTVAPLGLIRFELQ